MSLCSVSLWSMRLDHGTLSNLCLEGDGWEWLVSMDLSNSNIIICHLINIIIVAIFVHACPAWSHVAVQ